MRYLGQFLLLIIAIAVLIGLQYQYWHGENGLEAHKKLTAKIEKQTLINNHQIAQNSILKADVYDLKTGLEAVEEHARLDLGLIKPNETFVQFSTAPNVSKTN